MILKFRIVQKGSFSKVWTCKDRAEFELVAKKFKIKKKQVFLLYKDNKKNVSNEHDEPAKPHHLQVQNCNDE